MRIWKHRHHWVPLAFLLLGLLLILQLAIAGKNNDAERINVEARITAEQLKLRLESCFDSRASLVRTLANYPWRSREQLIGEWTSRASSLLPLYTGVQALNYVDADGVIRVVFPVEPNRAALNANLRENPNPSVRSSLERATTTGLVSRTAIVELLQGGKGFALYRPIISDSGETLGYVNGVFRVGDLMNSCLPEGRLRRYFDFRLMDGGEVFYEQTDIRSSRAEDFAVALEIDVIDEPWEFTIAPQTSYLDATDDFVDELWIILGLILLTLLTAVLRFALVKQRDVEAREDEYRLLVENQTDLVVKVNMQGEFQYISPSYCEMFGKSEAELIGFAFMPLVHEDDRELTQRSLERLTRPPYTSYHEQRAMTKDGWRWLAWSNRAVVDDDGNLVGITAVGRDVTEVKRLEERVAHTQKMRAMGELAGGITHDFNNLLQVILGNVEYLLLTGKVDEETKKSMESVRDVGLRAMSLTKKLATLSRQDLSKPELLDINVFLGELKGLLGHTLPSSVDLTVETPEKPLFVFGDHSQLEQVLLNLCFNARDAIDSKGRIAIEAQRRTIGDSGAGPDPELKAGEYVAITVTDDGHGIEAEDLRRIFDPFYTTKGTGAGTGLGLTNSYSIVEQHDGTITVESSPGDGSTFTVWLPLSSPGRFETASEQTAAIPGDRPTAGSGELALVADDNPELRELASKVLKRAGFETLVAANGKEALEIFRARQDEIRLLVLDLVMPEMSGQDVAAEVRKLSSDVSILLVSGYVPEDTKRELKEPIIRKPYTIDELMDALQEMGFLHDENSQDSTDPI